MDTTQDTRTVDDRSVLMDFLAFTPSPTLSRELFALVVTVVAAVVFVTIVDLSLVVEAVFVGVVALGMLARLAAGFATRGYGKGGR